MQATFVCVCIFKGVYNMCYFSFLLMVQCQLTYEWFENVLVMRGKNHQNM